MTETKPQPARHLGHGAAEGRLVLHLHRKLPLFSSQRNVNTFFRVFGHTHIYRELKSRNLTLSVSQEASKKNILQFTEITRRFYSSEKICWHVFQTTRVYKTNEGNHI